MREDESSSVDDHSSGNSERNMKKKNHRNSPNSHVAKKRKLGNDDTADEDEDDAWEIMWPYRSGVIGNAGECTVLLQIDAEDATNLDIEGASGAIGRLEFETDGVVLDMKGRQYIGRILPGPTALILEAHAFPNSKGTPGDEETSHLKVLGITDEFAQCERTGSTLDRLSAALEQGDNNEGAVVKNTNDDGPTVKEMLSAKSN